MRVFIIVPTYNEFENLPSLLTNIFKCLPSASVLIVDDASPDQTGKLAESLRQQYPEQLYVLHRPGKQGLGAAYVAGFKQALRLGADLVIQMDADHSHPMDALSRMVEESKNYDLVIGSRYVTGGKNPGLKGLRKLISRGGGFYARTILGLSIRDVTSGFKCFSRSVLNSFDLDAFRMTGYGFQIELIYKTFLMGFSIKEIPIIFQDRQLGKSKMDFRIFAEALLQVLFLRFGGRQEPELQLER